MNGEIAAKSGWGKTELEAVLDPFKKTSIEMGSYDHFRQYKGYYKFTLQTGKKYMEWKWKQMERKYKNRTSAEPQHTSSSIGAIFRDSGSFLVGLW